MNKKTLIILGLTTIFLLYPFLTYGSEIKYSNSKDITPDLHTVHMDMEGNFKALFINNLGEDIEITDVDLRNTVSETSCVGSISNTSVPAGEDFTINAVGCRGEHRVEPDSTYQLEITIHYLSNGVQNTETSILEGQYKGNDEIILLIMLGLALLLAKLFGEAFERIGQPSVIGEILVGVIIGHQVLGPMLGINVGGHVFHAFATVGIMLLLFLSGLEVELKKLKETGKLAIFVAIGGVLLPFAGGYAVGMWQFNDTYVAMLLGAILTATSVGVTARILMEAKVLDTKAGSTIIGAAVIDDILGILVIVIVSSIALTGGVSVEALGLLSLKMLVFFFLTVVVGLMVISRLTNLFEKMGTAKAFIALSLTMVFLFGVFAESVQIAAITGAFIAGMLIGETPFRRRAIEEVETIGYGFFIPLFFVWVGTWIDFDAFAG
ncbi:MAG: cation:proton antiporter, partial [Candidatus Altiarchaeota archaeon]|nr:cation:proton antiporter [Candidatus Altiarchaeota archaeon]